MMRRLSLVTALAVLALPVLSSAPASASGSVPFTDPSATSSITFCDLSGNAVTHGTLTANPFVWKAVGGARVPTGYEAPTSRATLAIFVPLKGVSPDQWSGEPITSGSAYTQGRPPAVQATSIDFSLKNFLGDYKLGYDSLLQVRLLVSATGRGITPTYAAQTIRVSGSTWSVAGKPGTAACGASTAVSDEIKTNHLPPDGVVASPTPSASPSGSKAGATGSSASPHPTVSPGQIGNADDPNPSDSAAASAAAAQAAGASAPPSGFPWPGVVVVVLTIVGIGIGSYLVGARRRPL